MSVTATRDNDQVTTNATVAAASLSLGRSDLIRSQNFIAGKWCAADSGALLGVVDPADNSRITQVPDSGAPDARAAVNAADAAFPAWRATPAKVRAQIIK